MACHPGKKHLGRRRWAMGENREGARAEFSRRDLLLRGGAGFGAVALAWMLDGGRSRAGTGETSELAASPLGPRPPHSTAKARSVIFLFMEGGPSHIDLFAPKPLVNQLDGQPIPPGFRGHLQAM